MTFRLSSLMKVSLSPPAAIYASLLGLVLFLTGCSEDERTTSPEPSPQANPNLDAEHWEMVLINGKSAGFQCVEIHPIEHDGEPAYKLDILSEMKATQFGTTITVRILGDAIMRPDGTPILIRETVQIGPDAHTLEGALQDDVLHATANISGTEQTYEMPWPDDAIFMIGVPFSLWTAPMQPGETRKLKTYEVQQDMIRHNLKAEEIETVQVGDQKRELLRIEDSLQIGQQTMQAVYWTDEEGTVVKSTMAGFAESFQSTREEALAAASAGTVDLGFGISVPVARSLEPPHETQSVRYRVTLRGEDPSVVFPESDFQTVEQIDDHSAFITVSAASLSVEGASVTPIPEDIEPTTLITSDAPDVLRLTEELSWSETPPETPEEAFQAAQDVVELVNEKMQAGFGRGIVSAAEAAETLTGDCTEHAILAAAIARSIGLPARTAIGLVYVDQSFCFHMWTEIQVQGRWIPFDATLRSRGVGAAHIKLAHSSFSGPFPLIELLPTLRVLGKMDLEIIEIEH